MEKKQIIEAMHNRLHEIDPHAKAGSPVKVCGLGIDLH